MSFPDVYISKVCTLFCGGHGIEFIIYILFSILLLYTKIIDLVFVDCQDGHFEILPEKIFQLFIFASWYIVPAEQILVMILF